MKKLLLLGDSIRMGYDSIVEDMLRGEYEVIYAEDNGRFTAYTLWQANQLFRQYGHFDVVHWNNGYWDMHAEAPMKEPISTIDEYSHMLRKILRLCRENADRVIFATSLPVPPPDEIRAYGNDTVMAYNEAAKKVMAEEKAEVNDLYSLIARYSDYKKCADGVHLTEEGYRICAQAVVNIIKK